MYITLSFGLEDYETKDMPDDVGYEEGQKDPQDFLLTPQELGDALVVFLKAVAAKGQLFDPVIQLPYYNDDSEDIAQVVFNHPDYSRLPCTTHFEFTHNLQVMNSYDHSQR